MTGVITMAVEREMNADKVMKHALSFFCRLFYQAVEAGHHN